MAHIVYRRNGKIAQARGNQALGSGTGDTSGAMRRDWVTKSIRLGEPAIR
jgi:hypothetical protein